MPVDFDPLTQAEFSSSLRHNTIVEGLRVDGLNVYQGKKQVLFDVNIAPIHPSCMVGIVGPRSSGKSVLLQTLAGLIKPESGEIFNGYLDLTILNERERIYQVSYLAPPQETPASVSVLDALLRSHEQIGGWHVKEDGLDAVNRILSDISLFDLANRSLASLSDAERRMVALGQVFIRNPRVVLLDDITRDLDPQIENMIFRKVRAIMLERNIIVLSAFRDFEFADKICGRIVRIFQGRVVEHI